MANIQIIQSGSLPQQSKEYIHSSSSISETESYDDIYILRTLIDKVNELVAEVNTLKNK